MHTRTCIIFPSFYNRTSNLAQTAGNSAVIRGEVWMFSDKKWQPPCCVQIKSFSQVSFVSGTKSRLPLKGFAVTSSASKHYQFESIWKRFQKVFSHHTCSLLSSLASGFCKDSHGLNSRSQNSPAEHSDGVHPYQLPNVGAVTAPQQSNNVWPHVIHVFLSEILQNRNTEPEPLWKAGVQTPRSTGFRPKIFITIQSILNNCNCSERYLQVIHPMKYSIQPIPCKLSTSWQSCQGSRVCFQYFYCYYYCGHQACHLLLSGI